MDMIEMMYKNISYKFHIYSYQSCNWAIALARPFYRRLFRSLIFDSV